MLLSDCMNERKYQQEIKNFENMAKYDQKVKEKNDLLKRKKDEQMRIINEQIQEAKFRRIKDHQEIEIEDFMARQDYLDRVKEDEIKAEKERERKNKLKEEFIKGNEEVKVRKRNKILQEIEEKKKEKNLN